MTNGRVAVLGGGRMGEALIAGVLRGDRTPEDVRVAERYADRAAELTDTYGVRTGAPADVVAGASVVLIATKPQDVLGVLAEAAPGLAGDQLFVSVAAGITCAAIETAVPGGAAVVRAMPNTPALVGQGMTAIAAGARAGEADLAAAEDLLRVVGRVERVAEAQLDAVTALSGSGPAYFFLAVESMVDAGVLLGLPRALATELVVQTAYGAASMLRESGDHPAQLREAVTSPGGTTAAALRELDERGLRAAFAAAIEAAASRSRELGAS